MANARDGRFHWFGDADWVRNRTSREAPTSRENALFSISAEALLHTARNNSIKVGMQRQSDHPPQPTTAQKRILRFVHEKLVASGSAPSQEEIAAQFGYRSLNTVRQHLRLLERKGAVRLHHRKADCSEIRLRCIPRQALKLG